MSLFEKIGSIIEVLTNRFWKGVGKSESDILQSLVLVHVGKIASE